MKYEKKIEYVRMALAFIVTLMFVLFFFSFTSKGLADSRCLKIESKPVRTEYVGISAAERTIITTPENADRYQDTCVQWTKPANFFHPFENFNNALKHKGGMQFRD